MSNPADLRRRYARGHLDDEAVAESWFPQLRAWFDEAVADTQVVEANAVQWATVTPEGRPAVRTVLVKGLDEHGIVVFSNYDSAKGRDLAVHPYAAAVLVWPAHERQVRLTGAVEKVSREETEAYFASRPRESQLGAWASPQSQVVESRAALDALVEQAEARFGDGPIPAPPNWGGYRLVPDAVEFWQGRPGRVHDRIRFRLDGTAWVRERLAP